VRVSVICSLLGESVGFVGEKHGSVATLRPVFCLDALGTVKVALVLISPFSFATFDTSYNSWIGKNDFSAVYSTFNECKRPSACTFPYLQKRGDFYFVHLLIMSRCVLSVLSEALVNWSIEIWTVRSDEDLRRVHAMNFVSWFSTEDIWCDMTEATSNRKQTRRWKVDLCHTPWSHSQREWELANDNAKPGISGQWF